MISSNLSAIELHCFGQVLAAKTSIEDDSLAYDDIANEFTLANLSVGGVSLGQQFGSNSTAIMQALFFENRVNLDLLQFKHSYSRFGTARIGRQRLPFFWFSENVQVNALLPWISSPREVYAKIPIYSFTGASIEKSFNYARFHFYAGHVKEKFEGEDVTYNVDSTNVIGLRFDTEVSFAKFFVNYYRSDSKLSIKASIPATVAQTTIGYEQDINLGQVEIFTSGVNFNFDRLRIFSEVLYAASESAAFKGLFSYYGSAIYSFNEEWQSVATFSRDAKTKSYLFPSKTTTIGLNLNYTYNFSNVFKIGIEQVNYKAITVPAPTLAGSSNAGTFALRPPGENFNIYSANWSFVY